MNKTTDTQIEALKLALEALKLNCSSQTESPATKAIAAIREALAEQPAQQQTAESPDGGTGFINGVWHAARQWNAGVPSLYPEPEPGVSIKATYEQPAQQQEPVAWATREDFYRELGRSVERAREEMKVKSVTMRCKDYDLALPIIDAHFGHVLVGQISTPPPSKPWVGLTDVERAEVQYEAHKNKLTPLEFMELHEAKLREKNA